MMPRKKKIEVDYRAVAKEIYAVADGLQSVTHSHETVTIKVAKDIKALAKSLLD